jgi:predicted nucleotidyltransferase
MLENRKVIFKCVTGSRLYGTNLPSSDEDYTGVFLPAPEDLLGLNTAPKEITDNIKKTLTARNGKGDVDCKYLSLHHFLKLVLEGQSIATELFFVPDNLVLLRTPEWDRVRAHTSDMFSRKGVTPFLGFAAAQAYKSTIKGSNLTLIRKLIIILRPVMENSLNTRTLSETFDTNEPAEVTITGVAINKKMADDNKTEVLEIAGRCFNLGIRLKMFVKALEKMESRYGSRSDTAAEKGIDHKSLCHAYRLLSEAEEFLLHQKITFPRPDAEFLKQVRRGVYTADFRQEITSRIETIRKVAVPESKLPAKPAFKKVNELCMEMMKEHLTRD